MLYQFSGFWERLRGILISPWDYNWHNQFYEYFWKGVKISNNNAIGVFVHRAIVIMRDDAEVSKNSAGV
ncbi:hypothetical protein AGMMS49940_14310 [Spirochaetia bacterium]|nr:hypothetical protein AGMMS49940_14310 [Spirochaetia bacterium]